MAQEDIEQKIKLTYETNADETSQTVNKLTDNVDKVTDSQSKATKSSKSQADALEGLGGSIGNAISGMKGMLKQMWLLVANPIVLTIVAIVGGLALLFKAFTSTNDGADKFDQILSGVSATIDILRDRFLKMAGAITKFMTGDFKGALADGKASVAGFGAEVEKEFKQAANATKELQEVEDAMRSLGETRAKLNRDLSEAKEIITDENATYAEKKKAIDAVRIAEGEQTEQELANAKRRLAAINLQNSLSDVSDENLKKASDAKIAVYNLEQESANNRRAINKADKRADNEENARLKAIATERAARAKEQADAEKAIREKAISDKKEYLNKANAAEDEFANLKTEKEIAEREKKQQDYENGLIAQAEKAANEKSVADNLEEEKKNRAAQEVQFQIDKDNAISSSQQNLNNIIANLEVAGLAKSKAGQAIMKGIALTQIGIDSAVALSKASALANAEGVAAQLAFPMVPGIGTVARVVSYASTAASVIGNIARAKKLLSGGSGGGNGSSGGGSQTSGGRGSSAGASATPQVNFQGSKENQIGNTIAGKLNEQAPIRVTVLENDITKVQNTVVAKVVSNSF